MAFRLDPQQHPSDSVLACIDAEVDAAIESLSVADPARRPAAVHDARKRIKKARSALRLVRSALDKRTARHLNGDLRDIAASLSDRRDADVLVATVASLHERHAGQLPAITFEALRERLAERAARIEDVGDHAAEIHRLQDVRAHLAKANFERVTWSNVVVGIDRSYRRGRRGYGAAAHAESEELHEWRKRAKDLWYHHRLIKDAYPRMAGAFAKDAHELSDLLGDDHDLAVLRATIIQGEAPAATAPVDLEPVVDLIDERRAQLQGQARRVARRLYADKPKAFSHRMRAVLGAFADDGREAAPAGSGPVAA